MATGVGLQINLDKGEGQIQSGKLIDDIRLPCAQFEVKFDCKDKLTFTIDNSCYITYRGFDWIPIMKHEFYTSQNTWHYELICHPKNAFQLISKPVQNTLILARSMNLQLTLQSTSLPIDCPVIDFYSSMLIQEFRRQSFNKAYLKGKMGDAYFIYFDTNAMMSVTWKQLVNQASKTLECYKFMQGQNIVDFVDDRIYNYATSSYGAKPWHVEDYLCRMLGQKITICGAEPAAFANMYTMRFTNTSEADKDVSFLCVRVEQDITQGAGFKNTFAEIKYVEGDEKDGR